jgi:3D (Asp-Asp-Asp) domain-containing protein
MARDRRAGLLAGTALAVVLAALLAPRPAAGQAQRMVVTVTAYTSRKSETDSRPFETACKDRMSPGDKTVAVSEDLYKLGLTCGSKIKIDGLDGEYVVNDKLPARKRNHIDLYAGMSLREAKAWGHRRVGIILVASGSSQDKPVCPEKCGEKERTDPASPITTEKSDGQPINPVLPEQATVK